MPYLLPISPKKFFLKNFSPIPPFFKNDPHPFPIRRNAFFRLGSKACGWLSHPEKKSMVFFLRPVQVRGRRDIERKSFAQGWKRKIMGVDFFSREKERERRNECGLPSIRRRDKGTLSERRLFIVPFPWHGPSALSHFNVQGKMNSENFWKRDVGETVSLYTGGVLTFFNGVGGSGQGIC